MAEDITMDRLEESITWYDQHAQRNQLMYKTLKAIVIIAAAAIPFLSGIAEVDKIYIGALGVVIAVAEGIQQLNQNHENWTAFRATCEALKHEKYLYLGKAGPYADASDARKLLAERSEALVSQETAKWSSRQETTEKKPPPPAENEKHD